MKTTSLWICGALLAGASTLATADQPGATTRDERMDQALSDYRAGTSTGTASNTSGTASSTECNQYADGGSFARAEAAMKRGACKTGHAIERGVKKTGHAVGNAGRKTGNAIRRTGEKMGGNSDTPSSSENTAK